MGWAELREDGKIPRDPFDVDGYCIFCGNGSWKYHMPECQWADRAYDLGWDDKGAIPVNLLTNWTYETEKVDHADE